MTKARFQDRLSDKNITINEGNNPSRRQDWDCGSVGSVGSVDPKPWAQSQYYINRISVWA